MGPMSRMKGAEVITEYLIKQQIPHVFGICGHGNGGLLDVLYDAREQIKLVSPRHEQVAYQRAGRREWRTTGSALFDEARTDRSIQG
jgi:thiamine pyrophosphate-dependent acetolactate synthase large subunit-like protein